MRRGPFGHRDFRLLFLGRTTSFVGNAFANVALAFAVLELTGSKADLRRVPYLCTHVLERSKRFQVADPLTVGELFVNGGARVEEVLSLPDRAMRMSTSLDVTGWVVPVLLERRSVTYLDATWISAVTGTALFSRRLPLVPPTAAEEQRFPWEPGVED